MTSRLFRARFHPSAMTASLAAALLAAVLPGPVAAAADLWPSSYRLQHSTGKFEDTAGATIAYRLTAPALLRAHHLELAVGSLAADDGSTALVSVGPVWRLPLGDSVAFADFGFSPTMVSNPDFHGRDLGGHFHFTSSLSFGMEFGKANRYELALRVQHTSNGGLNGDNPGLDMVGLNFSVDLDR